MIKLTQCKSVILAAALTAMVAFYPCKYSYADTNIAVADTTRIMETSLAYKDIVKQLEKKYEGYRESIQKSEAQIKKKNQEVEAQKSALSKEAFEAKNEELAKDAAELQRRSYNERNILEKAHADSVQKLGDKVLDIIQSRAKSMSYNLILDKNSSSYDDEKLDITASDLEDLDKALPTVQVDFEAARKGAESAAAAANDSTKDDTKGGKNTTSVDKKSDKSKDKK